MKFNKLAKELDHSVAELADKVSQIIPNANAGTDVSDAQKAQIMALLQAPTLDAIHLSAGSADPILAVLFDRIEEESERSTPEQVVDQMIERYLTDPDDLPAEESYREAIVRYVELVKKRHTRRQQQSSRVRSLLGRQALLPGEDVPLNLERFYSTGPGNGALGSKPSSPQLNAATS